MKKSHPKGIDPAYPQKNFVVASAENHGEDKFEALYGGTHNPWTQNTEINRKASNYGHSIGQRAGKLRLSGMAGAHRIGKRK